VAENLPEQYFRSDQRSFKQPISKQAARNTSGTLPPFQPVRKFGGAFQANVPAVDQFPIDVWTRLSGRVFRRLTPSELAIGDVRGELELRREILDHFGPARQVRADIDQLIIVSGVQQALDFLCRVLLQPGDAVWFENPGYIGARNIFRAAGATIVPVPVDRQGLQVEEAIATFPIPKLIYLTPAHQFPTGATLALNRRFKILTWACSHNVVIFEDDYDGDFRFATKPLGSVQGLDIGECVAYCTSFSKLLFPSLRLGFMVLPRHLVDRVLALRGETERFLPVPAQKVLAEFMRTGEFGHHLRRMRELYAERWSILSDAAEKWLSNWLELTPAECGLQTAAWLLSGGSDTRIAAAAARQDVEVYPISTLYAASGKPRHGFLLGFGAVPPQELCRGARRLAEVLGQSKR
jgi:GntR family transcriptional regulator/MocR family aminotransferase